MSAPDTRPACEPAGRTRLSRFRAAASDARTGLRENPGTLRLSIVRLTGQFGDGMFQAALSGAILFNPERETDPLAIAAGFAALLLPYSVIGPFAGALLDRWDRRRVLLVANVLRGALIALTAAGLLAGAPSPPLLVLALAVIGTSRFIGAGVSAALPRVLDKHWLVPMNSVLVTISSACAFLGAGIGFGIIGVIGAGDTASAIAVAVSASGSVLGGLAAAGFRPHVLGPDRVGGAPPDSDHADLDPARGAPRSDARSSVRAIAAGLRRGAGAAWHSREVTTALLGIGAHRMALGMNALLVVLVLRRGNWNEDAAYLARFSAAITATGAGMLVAALVAPWVIPRWGKSRTVVAALGFAIVVQLALLTPITLATGAGERRAETCFLAGLFLLGIAGQTIKLTGDAAMQMDIDDLHRGQVFALQDTIFNMSYVGALALTAVWIPIDGRAPAAVLIAAGIYALGIAAIALNSRRTP